MKKDECLQRDGGDKEKSPTDFTDYTDIFDAKT